MIAPELDGRRSDAMTTAQAQQFTFAAMLLITAAIAAIDVAMIRWFGRETSISHLMGWCFGRYPTIGMAFVFWLGVWCGHVWLFHGPTE
jgi:hypothetical protein